MRSVRTPPAHGSLGPRRRPRTSVERPKKKSSPASRTGGDTTERRGGDGTAPRSASGPFSSQSRMTHDGEDEDECRLHHTLDVTIGGGEKLRAHWRNRRRRRGATCTTRTSTGRHRGSFSFASIPPRRAEATAIAARIHKLTAGRPRPRVLTRITAHGADRGRIGTGEVGHDRGPRRHRERAGLLRCRLMPPAAEGRTPSIHRAPCGCVLGTGF